MIKNHMNNGLFFNKKSSIVKSITTISGLRLNNFRYGLNKNKYALYLDQSGIELPRYGKRK